MTATPADHPWIDDTNQEPLDEGGAWLLDLVAAVGYLRRGIRPDFNVWDALEEALRWWTTEQHCRDTGAPDPDAAWNWEDPLLETLRWLVNHLDDQPDVTASEAFQQAIRHWTLTMADRFNGGYRWPSPFPLSS